MRFLQFEIHFHGHRWSTRFELATLRLASSVSPLLFTDLLIRPTSGAHGSTRNSGLLCFTVSVLRAMSNKGKGKAESDTPKDGSMTSMSSIEGTTRGAVSAVHPLVTAGEQLTAAGQQIKSFGRSFGEFTSVGTALKTAGESLAASGLHAAGHSLIAAGYSLLTSSVAEVPGSPIGNPGTSSQVEGPGTEELPGTDAFYVGISAQQGYNYFSLGALNDGHITDTGPTLEFNRLSSSDSSVHGSLPAGTSAGSPAGSD